MKHILVALVAMLFVLGAARTARADSPLTSTDFYEAYLDVPMVKRAHAIGHMTPEIAMYFESPVNSLDARIAAVNALGWNFNGKGDADTFARLAWGKPAAAVVPAPLRGDELLVLGYLEIMDDYFHPVSGLAVLEKAKEKLPRSLIVAAIVGLARAQRDMDKSFCAAGTRLVRRGRRHVAPAGLPSPGRCGNPVVYGRVHVPLTVPADRAGLWLAEESHRAREPGGSIRVVPPGHGWHRGLRQASRLPVPGGAVATGPGGEPWAMTHPALPRPRAGSNVASLEMSA